MAAARGTFRTAANQSPCGITKPELDAPISKIWHISSVLSSSSSLLS
ncbi:hypothetical protein GMORB2_5048 [Geosmithia morbida]|uniref:Uncharacterized protein n=1 Tax=Geosmithia morbida TaxID=1094350 RepID=A0A9P5D2Z1_9HYPO|nr:uncharacterized protein GMORB2_5048 [Geosmithia morbida]KAF4124382.1 hypothetical protein GMORB2_5048 [Geosmithia morbida]